MESDYTKLRLIKAQGAQAKAKLPGGGYAHVVLPKAKRWHKHRKRVKQQAIRYVDGIRMIGYLNRFYRNDWID